MNYLINWIKSKLYVSEVYIVQVHVDFKYPYSYILGTYTTMELAASKADKETASKPNSRSQIWRKELCRK